jgi:hypothetical protein
MEDKLEKSRIKPLVKKMSRREIEELCERKKWRLIDEDFAVSNLDAIPYDMFWISGYADSYGENRPKLLMKTAGGHEVTTCHPNFLEHCVVIKKDRTIVDEYEKILESIDFIDGHGDITHPEKKAIDRVKTIVSLMYSSRKEYMNEEYRDSK